MRYSTKKSLKKAAKRGTGIIGAAAIFLTGYTFGKAPFNDFQKELSRDVTTINSYISEPQKREFTDSYVESLLPNERIKLLSNYIREMDQGEQTKAAFTFYDSLSTPNRDKLSAMISDSLPKDKYDRASDFIRDFVEQVR